MAKLGQNEFPEIGLADSIELTRRIYDDLGGEVRRDGLAIVLGMSPTGGAYGARIGALRMWGLASGRGLIRLTEDGVRIASPTSVMEETDVMRKLAASVPLFNELHHRIGDSTVDQSVLAVMLQEITGADISDVMRRVAMVERIFASIHGLLNQLLIDNDDSVDAKSDDASARKSSTTGEIEPLRRGWMELRYDDGSLRMRETVQNLDVLIGTLEARRNRLMGDEL